MRTIYKFSPSIRIKLFAKPHRPDVSFCYVAKWKEILQLLTEAIKLKKNPIEQHSQCASFTTKLKHKQALPLKHKCDFY